MIVKFKEEILAFCKDWKSPTEVGMTLLGRPYNGASSSASPKLKKLVGMGLMERNSRGHYKTLQARKQD